MTIPSRYRASYLTVLGIYWYIEAILWLYYIYVCKWAIFVAFYYKNRILRPKYTFKDKEADVIYTENPRSSALY